MATTMPASTIYVLPFTLGSVTAKDAWTAASSDWATTVTDQSQGSILAPAMGQLSGVWDQSTGDLTSFTIDSAQFSPCRQLFSHDPNQAFITRFVITGASGGTLSDALDLSTFNPDWLTHQQGAASPLNAHSLLAQMQSTAGSTVSVKAGDVLGTLNATSVEIRCYLSDGSLVPLSWAYNTLVNGGYLDPTTAKDAFVTSPVTPVTDLTIAEDPFSILSKATSGLTIQLSWSDASAFPPVSSTQPPTARRFVIELPGDVDSVETELNLNVNSAAATVAATISGTPGDQPNSPCVLPEGAFENPVALTLGTLDGAPAQVVITSPPPQPGNSRKSVLIVSQQQVQLGGAASDMTNLTATLNGAPTDAFTEAGNGKWNLALDFSDTTLPVPSELVFLSPTSGTSSEGTSTQTTTLTVEIYPLAINPGAVDPNLGLPITANGDTSDTSDSLVMEASLTNGAALAAAIGGTLTAQWTLSVNCAVPQRVKKYIDAHQTSFTPPINPNSRTGQPYDFSACTHWIDFTMSSTSSSTPDASWGPGPMQLQTTTVTCDNPRETTAYDTDVKWLQANASWAGNNGQSAGPLCGDATLSATLQDENGSNIFVAPGSTFKVRGYDLHTISFATFLQAVQNSLRRAFNNSVSNPTSMPIDPYTQDNLNLHEADFINILLAIFTIESSATIVQFNPQRNAHSIPTMPSVMQEPPSFLPVWGPPAGTGVGQKDPSTIATMFDWRGNVDACAVVLCDCFRNPDIKDREKYRLRSVAKNSGAHDDGITASLDDVDVSATSDFQQALSANERLYLCVKKYNGRPPPVISNYGWTDGQGFVPHPEKGNAIDTWTQHPDPDPRHYIHNFIPQYAKVQEGMVAGITTWPPWLWC